MEPGKCPLASQHILRVCLHVLVPPQHLTKKEEGVRGIHWRNPCCTCPGRKRQSSVSSGDLHRGVTLMCLMRVGCVCVHLCGRGEKMGCTCPCGCTCGELGTSCIGGSVWGVGVSMCAWRNAACPGMNLGRGCTDAHVIQDLPPPVQDPLNVGTNIYVQGLSTIAASSVSKTCLCSGIIQVPASPITTGLGLLTPRRKGDSHFLSKLLPPEVLFMPALLLLSLHLDTGICI